MRIWYIERNEDYLEHHGIKGQKWGVRRYQNEDGSLTKEGINKAKSLASFYKEYLKLNQKYKDTGKFSNEEKEYYLTLSKAISIYSNSFNKSGLKCLPVENPKTKEYSLIIYSDPDGKTFKSFKIK